MVGFTPHESVRLTQTEFAVAGAISGSITRCLCQPLDVLKIRFQLQLEPISGKHQRSKYSGVVQAWRCIVREEGVPALWKGHVPAQLLSITYGMAQYASFEMLTQAVWYVLPHDLTTTRWRPLTHAVCGGLSGCMATLIIQPIDILRTRIVAQGEPKKYRGLLDACSQMMRQEGPLSFYKGLTPALIQVFPQMGLQFGFYSLFTGLWNRTKGVWFDSAPVGYLETAVCGTGSGLASKLIIYPLDMAKKRLQVQGFESARAKFGATGRYAGLTSCLVQVLKAEGVRGLYKGLTPGLLKAGLVAGCNFTVYERVCHVLVMLKSRHS